MMADLAGGFTSFAQGLKQGKAQLVWQEFAADLETPVSCYLKLVGNDRNGFLLESVEGGAARGRYSFIGLAPDVIWRCQGKQASVAMLSPSLKDRGEAGAADMSYAWQDETLPPLDSLKKWVASLWVDLPPHLPPMSAGLFGYLAYDAVRLVEAIPDDNPDELGVADGLFIRPTLMLIFDHVQDRLTLATPVWPKDNLKDDSIDNPNDIIVLEAKIKEVWEQAWQRLHHALDRLQQPLAGSDFGVLAPTSGSMQGQSASLVTTLASEGLEKLDPSLYLQAVAKAKDYILAGDIFQVVLSQRFSLPYDLPPFQFYRALRRTNPAPYLFFMQFDEFAIAGSSPEILVRVRNGKVTIRPLAGTRHRGQTLAEDQALERELMADEKERAEHLMLLDLGRNDVGRVAKIGSVKVTASYMVERYSHVMHLVSNVEGELAEGKDCVDALLAGFPAGTVSGAPKVRAMEIIDELEIVRRGIYAGCVGYFAADGSMDSCIALRTAVIHKGKLHVQSGAGIVADSQPRLEQAECEAKAGALFQAWQRAMTMTPRN